MFVHYLNTLEWLRVAFEQQLKWDPAIISVILLIL